MAARDERQLNLELLGQSRRRKFFPRMAMAHGERRRAYGLVGNSAARAFRTAMARAPFDGPWQGRAEGRGRCARGSRPNRRTGMAKRTVVGCRQRNREGASRSAASRGMVGIGRDGMGRTWRGSAGAGRYAASWRMVEMGTCGRGPSNSRSPRAGPSKNPTTHSPLYCTSLSFSLGQGQSRNAGLAASELGDEALLPYFHPHSTSLSFSLGQGQNEQPPV